MKVTLWLLPELAQAVVQGETAVAQNILTIRSPHIFLWSRSTAIVVRGAGFQYALRPSLYPGGFQYAPGSKLSKSELYRGWTLNFKMLPAVHINSISLPLVRPTGVVQHVIQHTSCSITRTVKGWGLPRGTGGERSPVNYKLLT